MSDIPVPGQKFSKEAIKLKNEIEAKELELRVMKLKLRKETLNTELIKIDYEIVNLSDRLNELNNREGTK
jgi:hypothetical protein